MKRQNKKKQKRIGVLSVVIGLCIIGLIILLIVKGFQGKNQSQVDPATPEVTASTTPTESVTPGPNGVSDPDKTIQPGEPTPSDSLDSNRPPNDFVIRTDYEAFNPNEIGEIPIVMFHRFIKAYESDTEKEFTTTFEEFEALLHTLYNEGYRLISMQDFIDCNILVPAGTKPMVFTFDDGSEGQFNLIEENGNLKVNPDSAVGVMMKFNEEHPDFGLKGMFYINMDIGDNTFKGSGTLKERFELLEGLGFELGNHTWGHVKLSTLNTIDEVEKSMGKNQQKVEEILPGIRFYSLALPHGIRPKSDSLWPYLQNGSYDGIEYRHETIMAVGANPTVPSISKDYNSQYVARIRAQGKVPVDCDLTWWLPKMTEKRMFISDGDPDTIVVPNGKSEKVDLEKLNGKKLITY